MSRVDLLDDAYAKIDWSKKRLDEAKTEIATFVDSGPYEISDEMHTDSGDYVFRVRPKPPPPEIPLLVSDVICSIRPSLDYLVYALAILDTGQSQEDTQFPICDTPKKFTGQKGRIKWLSDPHQTAIEQLQPYPGRQGNQWLAQLRDLSNPDKHKRLHTTAALVKGEFTYVQHSNIGIPLTTGFGERIVYVPTHETDVPPGGSEVNVKFGLSVGVAFDGGARVVETLEVLQSQTRQLIDAFKPEF